MPSNLVSTRPNSYSVYHEMLRNELGRLPIKKSLLLIQDQPWQRSLRIFAFSLFPPNQFLNQSEFSQGHSLLLAWMWPLSLSPYLIYTFSTRPSSSFALTSLRLGPQHRQCQHVSWPFILFSLFSFSQHQPMYASNTIYTVSFYIYTHTYILLNIYKYIIHILKRKNIVYKYKLKEYIFFLINI